MTVELTDRIEMAVSDDLSLDELFELLERMPVPEGYKAEIVEGTVHMSPQRDAHWEIIATIYDELRSHYVRSRLKSDVRMDFPGEGNAFAPDMVALKEGAQKGKGGRWRHEDIEFIAEVISRGTAANDYGPKRDVYAAAGVPVYLIADPYTATCHVFTHPKDGEYQSRLTAKFGEILDLTGTVVDLELPTADFPREAESA